MESNLNYLNIEIFSPEKVHPNFTDHFKDDLYYNQCPHLCNPVAFCVLFELENVLNSGRDINTEFSISNFIYKKCLRYFLIHGDFSKEILVDDIGDSAFVKYYHIYTNRCKYEAMLALAFGSIAITGKVNSDIHKNAKKLLKERARRKSSSSIEAIMLKDLEDFPHVTECFFEL